MKPLWVSNGQLHVGLGWPARGTGTAQAILKYDGEVPPPPGGGGGGQGLNRPYSGWVYPGSQSSSRGEGRGRL